ncbi:uncharacterized protein LOC130500043 [Raphanus sativus]|uniref:Uncharacterized protein LOC130500043 n=1 Tax=Raphanus sativus TaxID=3726 RepID=A0A9W3CGJ0_RAPSA|nr:uncharacterized protein LOC130500043 [Raphanus sativus]
MYACLNCGKGLNNVGQVMGPFIVDSVYERGARSFVNDVTAKLGVNGKIVCPCARCRNLNRHTSEEVVSHLVINGMDDAYKVRSDWFHHGDGNSVDVVGVKDICWNAEILRLYEAANCLDDDLAIRGSELRESVEGEDRKEDEFLAKLAEAETPLYPTCSSHSKLSAVVSLFRIKSQNGWSDKSFDDLLQTLPNIKKLTTAESYPKCKASRWKTNMHTGEIKKGVPQKVLRYFPVIPRLKRMFRSEQLAMDLRWHFNNKSTDGKLRHPVDSVTWQSMNDKYPAFGAEERNLRLGLSTDGFNPFSMKNSRYSCWPVLLVNYNMAPHLCMKEENIMLTLLIPGPHQPGNSIDVYLGPLIEDLKHLWCKGELTYDAVSKTTFNLKAMLLWTISDFPAYGNLAGCKVKGKMGCPICGKHTDSLWLSNSRKFELPIRHNLDVMHVERNVAASLIATLLHCGNSKDGLKARKDLESLGIRKDLHPKAQGKRTLLPAAPWSLSKSEKHTFCKRLFDFKGPDGYCANISSCISLEECKVMGLKSHDYHVLMQQLLPVAIRGLLRKGPRVAIFRLCAFFNLLCQRELDVEQLQRIETEIVETLCIFERFWPPSFFDIMVHLCVHLGREARLGGPVHFRWMYPFERYMKVLKDYVRNTARPEGCIAESYLADECMKFCSAFLKTTTNVEEKADRNTEYESHSILEGRPISAARSFQFSDTELKIAHLAVIQNTAMVDPYVDAHLQHLQDSNSRCQRDATYLWRMHTEKFAAWLKQQKPIDSADEEETLKWLAYGPRSIARSYTGYIVNGLRFHTKAVHRLSQNSGVYTTRN